MRPTSSALGDAATAFDAVVPGAAWAQMQRHARVRLDVEVGGVLIGKTVAREDGRPYLFIEAGIPALAAESRETNITFTAEAWTRIHEVIDRDHPGAAIVGWYHTHPSFGIFLSEMDVFIQRHFFDLPHQVAIVIDPVAKTHGCFAWRCGVPTLGPLHVEIGEVRSNDALPTQAKPIKTLVASLEKDLDAADFHRPARAMRRSAIDAAGTVIDPLSRLERSQWIALAALLLLTFVLFAALTLMWLDVSPAEVFQRVRSLTTASRGAAAS